MMNSKRFAQAALIAGVAVSGPAMAELSANLTVNNNYIWRGLTQSLNEATVSGGIDYAHSSGFYAGTWVSNVAYGADDAFGYEHDVYFGIAGGDAVAWDIGYLYYNYDDGAGYDFGEVYASIGMGGLSATVYALSHTERKEVNDTAAGTGLFTETPDYDFGSATYISLDYGFETANGLGVSFHVGRHDGDWVRGFNFTPTEYMDYNISIAKNGFGMMISKTDLEETDGTGQQDFAGTSNDDYKFVVSYSVDFDLTP